MAASSQGLQLLKAAVWSAVAPYLAYLKDGHLGSVLPTRANLAHTGAGRGIQISVKVLFLSGRGQPRTKSPNQTGY